MADLSFLADRLQRCNSVEAIQELFQQVDNVVRYGIMPRAKAIDPTRTGGSFSFWRDVPEMGCALPVVCFPVGMVSPPRSCKYIHFANAKPAELSLHADHLSSWQSRDASDADRLKHKYGGCIRVACGLYFSFSGFDEHEDEAICAIVAYRLRLIDLAMVNQIADISDNQMLRDLIPEWCN